MKYSRIVALIAAIIISSPSLGTDRLHKAVLDLTSYNLQEQSASFKLTGDVEFYWNKLLSPADFKTQDLSQEPFLVHIPKSWASYRIDGKKLPSNGFATYRFWVDIKCEGGEKILGVKIPSIFTSYKLWVNGELISQAGNLATSKSDHKPEFAIGDIPFVLNYSGKETERIEFVVQVSNFSHRRAGIAWPMYFGSFDTIKRESRNLDILNLIVIGIILIIGLNHINMYLFRRKDISNLYFGILSLVMILRNLTTGDRLLAYIIPDINWEFLLTLDNFSGYGTIPFFALFIYNLYKDDFPLWMRNALVILGVLISIFIFATPAAIFGKFNMIFELYLLVGGLYLTFGVLLVAAFRGRQGAFLTFLGMFFLYATAINDVLSSMELIQTPYVAAYGLVIFMLLQSFTITSKSAKAINQNENLSFLLAQEKEGLERNIEERTRELMQQHDVLIEHQEKEKIQSWINKGVTRINTVLSTDKNDFEVLSRKVLTTVVKYMGVKLGALYVINDEDDTCLQMVAHYGGNKELLERNGCIAPGDGLVGAVFADNEMKVIENIPEGYYQVTSGLGSSVPKNMLLSPLSTDEAVFGVIELARFDDFKPEEIDFVKKIANSIAINLNNTRMNERNITLIKQFQEQTAEIQEKEEKMRESLEELEYYRENYHRAKEELEKFKKEQGD
ncbi:MAG: 7TM diverse intracellular signaling domain-containing protein [Tenuifilaceae bacterium]|jgi:ABC-type oligopeptide transport system ATPase subunit|nr:7TM diverse intracellular signaling domain-containing protein [Tenuifilaceae bacterium]